MERHAETNRRSAVLVNDFDGTMTRHDFFKLAIERLLPSSVPDYWSEYRSGEITHFEALRRYFADIRTDEEDVLAVVRQMELDPQLPEAVASLRSAGWRIVIASAGCDWYIRHLLLAAGVDAEVHANPGQFVTGKGLLMEMPTHSPFCSPTLGVDKAGVVRSFLSQGATVAFAGDGFPDADAARLVPAALRFARGDLADVLRSERLAFHSFDSWSEVADVLLRQES